MVKRTPLIIAAIAVMLMAASSAYGYVEGWSGWFSSGTLYYGGNPYTYSGSGGTAYDPTIGTIDTFYLPSGPINAIPFVYSAANDTIYLTVSAFAGSKPTGTTGTKEGSGAWSGSAIRRGPSHDPQTFTSVVGTWDTNGATEYFDYRPATPTYSAGWDVSYSNPLGITGGGSSSGSRTYFRNP